MTPHRPTNQEKHKCAWCGYPGALHQGGYQKSNGATDSEWFCNVEHFELWLRWQSMLAPLKEQSRIVPFDGEVSA